MKRYVAKRLFTGILTVLVVMVLNFVIVRLAPGNPVSIMAGLDNPNETQMAMLNARYGLDQPLPVQLLKYMGQVFRGDLGTSYTYNQSVASLIG